MLPDYDDHENTIVKKKIDVDDEDQVISHGKG